MRAFLLQKFRPTTGEMYIEITPITFRVRVKQGIALSQLRLFYGKPIDCEINAKELFGTVLKEAHLMTALYQLI